ncbi:MAG: DUF6090 family protein, partial [Melioribacteraceae bacterium]|nr:DUF6090 family protein [Melioribacteraceae bacterium]
MLTFFRRIRLRMLALASSDTVRKGLLGSGQARKYLVYAIGEVLLVMIGILLALQVNNWNQDRMIRTETANYREKLINDLSVDTINLNRHIEEAGFYKAAITSYLHFFENGEFTITSIIDSVNNVYAPYRIGRYFPINFTFSEMQSSAKLGL